MAELTFMASRIMITSHSVRQIVRCTYSHTCAKWTVNI